MIGAVQDSLDCSAASVRLCPAPICLYTGMAGWTRSSLVLEARIGLAPAVRPTASALLDSFLPGSGGWFAALLAALCLFAYAPAINNGFISDDYLMLEWVRVWTQDFSYLFKIAPDVFRITSYAVLWMLERFFGHSPEFFYAFVILVHFVNSLLLWKVLRLVTRSPQVSSLAAIVFVVFQNPQEAVMWLAAMGDALAGLCVLGALLLWLRKHFVASALCYLVGLFSKESAIVFLFLLPLIEFSMTRQVRLRRQHLPHHPHAGILGRFRLLRFCQLHGGRRNLWIRTAGAPGSGNEFTQADVSLVLWGSPGFRHLAVARIAARNRNGSGLDDDFVAPLCFPGLSESRSQPARVPGVDGTRMGALNLACPRGAVPGAPRIHRGICGD